MARTHRGRRARLLRPLWQAVLTAWASLLVAGAEPPPPGRPAPPPLPPVFREGTEVLPIDLPTALRLADAANPTTALARQRVEEAYAAWDVARFAWLPNLVTGPTYDRHDGRLQDTVGNISSPRPRAASSSAAGPSSGCKPPTRCSARWPPANWPGGRRRPARR